MAELKGANTNPWYVLMTLYEEQEGEEIDWHLHAQNLEVWNAWACQDLDDEERAKLTADGVELPEPGAWDAMATKVKRKHRAEFKRRNGEAEAYPGLPDVGNRVNLSEITFSNTVVLEKVIFTQDAFFRSATFTQDAFFRSATFTQAADFRSATFTQGAYFSSATFTQAAFFRSATFTQGAYFSSATFTQGADFISATFTQDADFMSATFTQGTYFMSATFTQDAYFMSATFTQGAYFSSATFTEGADFMSAVFEGRAYFLRAKFGEPVENEPSLLRLTDAQFSQPANFRDAKFLNRYPDFTGTIVHDKSLFPSERQNWPGKTDQDATKGRDSCAFLRHHVSKQGQPEAEHFFFRREMQFAEQIGGFWERLPYRLFGWVSDYGHSIAQPAKWLGCVWLGCALIYMVVFNWPGAITPSEVIPAGKGFGFSLANMFKFFGFQRTYYPDLIEALPRWLKFLAAFQTVVSYVLIFFLGLGLRQRFRLR